LVTVVMSLQYHHGDAATDETHYAVFTASSAAQPLVLVLGLLAFTTDFRHKTITPTLLHTTSRWRAASGKSAAYLLLGLAFGAVAVVVNGVVAFLCLRMRSVPIELFSHGIPSAAVRNLVSLAVLAVIGVGVGMLVRNQAAAVVIGIAYLFVLNPLLAVIPVLRRAYPFQPSGALGAFLAGPGSYAHVNDDVPQLAWGVAGLVLLLWCLLLLGLGTYLLSRRDID
jgi:hypothetical protein